MDLAKAYVQIVPSAEGIEGSLTSLFSGEAASAGSSSGESLANSLFSKMKSVLVGLGIGKAISDAINQTGEFETTMAKVSTLFTGTEAEFASLSQTILDVSSQTGMAATTLAEAAYSAESAGVPVEMLGQMIEKSAQLAVAGFTDVDTALSATAKTMNAYGVEGEDAMNRVQTVLLQTQNLGITTVGELGASLANVTPTAAALGVSFEQVGAAMALMTSKGVPTAQATTQLRAAMTELGKAGTTADTSFRAAAEGSEYAGMSFQEAIAAGANLGDVFGMMQSYAESSGLSMVDLWGSVEAGNAAMMIAGDVETFTSDLEAMSSTADVLGDSYGKMAESFGQSMNQLKESARNLVTTLFEGGDISASLDSLLQSAGNIGDKILTWISNGIGGIADAIPTLISGLFDFGAGLLGSIANVDWADLGSRIIDGLIGGLGSLETNIGTTLSTALTNAIGSIGEILPTIMQKGSDIAQQLLDGLNQTAPGIADAIGTIMDSIASAITTAFPAISSGVAEILTAFEPLVSDITGAFTDIASTVASAVTEIVAGLTPYIPAVTEMVTSTVEQIPSIVDSFNGIVSTVTDAITSIVEAVAPYIPAVTDMVSKTVEQLPDIVTAFNGIVDTVSSAITSIVEAVAPYIPNITSMVETTMSSLPEIVTAFQGLADTIPGIIDSIAGAIGKIGDAITGIIDSVGTNLSTIADAFSGLFDSLSGPIEAIGSLIESIGTAIGTVVEAVGSCVASINDSFARVLDSLKGVIDSIGEGAVKAGEGFSTLADAIIKLVNQTGFFDLASTLTSVAAAVGQIADTGRRAGDAYQNLEKLVGTLGTLAEEDFGTMAADLETVANKLYIITTYTPSLKDTKSGLDDLGNVKLSDLCGQMDNAIDKIEEFKTEVDTNTQAIIDQFGTMVTDSEAKITSFDWTGLGTDLTDKIAGGIKEKASSVTGNMETVAKDAASKMSTYNWANVGRDIISGIVSGINNNSGTLYSKLRTVAQSALAAAKSALGISSPSKVMRDEVGRWIPEGIAAGITANADVVEDAMNRLSTDMTSVDLQNAISSQNARIQRAASSINSTVTVSESSGLTDQIVSAVREGLSNATVNSYIDGELVTFQVSKRLGDEMNGRRFVYG